MERQSFWTGSRGSASGGVEACRRTRPRTTASTPPIRWSSIATRRWRPRTRRRRTPPRPSRRASDSTPCSGLSTTALTGPVNRCVAAAPGQRRSKHRRGPHHRGPAVPAAVAVHRLGWPGRAQGVDLRRRRGRHPRLRRLCDQQKLSYSLGFGLTDDIVARIGTIPRTCGLDARPAQGCPSFSCARDRLLRRPRLDRPYDAWLRRVGREHLSAPATRWTLEPSSTWRICAETS